MKNPGPAGWCWYDIPTCWAAAGTTHQTNNYAEPAAVRDALLAIPALVPLELRLDSQYTLSALTKWRFGWARNGWRTSKGQSVANRDLIEEIGGLMRGRDLTFVKVKAHMTSGGDRRNEAADQLARAAATAIQRSSTPNTGPGYSHP